MSLKIPVYISDVNNLSDARYCAGMGVEWLGFALNDDNLTLFEGIQNWVEGVKFVAEFKLNNSVAHIPDYFNGLLVKDESTALDNHPFNEYFLSLTLENKYDFQYLLKKPISDKFIIILEEGSNDIPLDTEMRESLKQLCAKKQVILGFGIQTDHLDWILKELKPKGIMLKGGEEIKPGLKDFDDLAEILEALEEND